ncbi:unnamed protein product [Symbiodinium sp. CCMP2592]|nr:unnamed protein product [Symbiodinium sp. CCMP2592]
MPEAPETQTDPAGPPPKEKTVHTHRSPHGVASEGERPSSLSEGWCGLLAVRPGDCFQFSSSRSPHGAASEGERPSSLSEGWCGLLAARPGDCFQFSSSRSPHGAASQGERPSTLSLKVGVGLLAARPGDCLQFLSSPRGVPRRETFNFLSEGWCVRTGLATVFVCFQFLLLTVPAVSCAISTCALKRLLEQMTLAHLGLASCTRWCVLLSARPVGCLQFLSSRSPHGAASEGWCGLLAARPGDCFQFSSSRSPHGAASEGERPSSLSEGWCGLLAARPGDCFQFSSSRSPHGAASEETFKPL